jgi:site-specific recombinase XerD
MSAIRKLAAEAADNELLAPELAAGIRRVKSAKAQGIRVGNWLSLRQAQSLLSAPDITTVRGLRDRAVLAVLLGCGLRRSEVAALTFTHLQQRWVDESRSPIVASPVQVNSYETATNRCGRASHLYRDPGNRRRDRRQS